MKALNIIGGLIFVAAAVFAYARLADPATGYLAAGVLGIIGLVLLISGLSSGKPKVEEIKK